MPGFFAEVVHSVVGSVDFIIDTADLDLDGGEMVGLFVVYIYQHFFSHPESSIGVCVWGGGGEHTNAVNLSCKSLNCSS